MALSTVIQPISGNVVNNTTVCVYLDVIFLDQKLHVPAGSGHHQVLSFDSLKIILYNSLGGVFDEEISTSKPLLEHSISMYYYVVHPHAQYRGTTLQQGF